MWVECQLYIAFRVRITVKIGVRVYTALTAMQSLHALGNLCVCAHGWMYLYNLFVFACVHVYLHFLFYSCMYNIYLTFCLLLLPQLLVVRLTHGGVWRFCVKGHFRKQTHITLCLVHL